MLNDENIISKSRSIIDLRNVNLTIQEFRLMEVYLSKINPQDETTASVTFTKQEYCDLMEIQSRLLESKRLNKYMQHLFNNSVTEWLEDGESFEMHPLFEKAKFDKKNSTKKRITRKDKNMTEYEMKALRITELARNYSRLHNVPDVDEKRAEIEQEMNQLKKELKEAHENGKC